MPSKAQIDRDINALRGLFTRNPKPMDMSTISLMGGEGLHAAVAKMVEDVELIQVEIHGRTLYLPTDNMKPYDDI